MHLLVIKKIICKRELCMLLKKKKKARNECNIKIKKFIELLVNRRLSNRRHVLIDY